MPVDAGCPDVSLLRLAGVPKSNLITSHSCRSWMQMGEELALFNAQAAEYKEEIARITRELREVKRKYFEQKKKETVERDRVRAERAQEEREAQVQESRMTVARFTGGGFNLSQGAS
eukprot:scaffold75273_cov31-Tisochrysis_lutea.AAC.1